MKPSPPPSPSSPSTAAAKTTPTPTSSTEDFTRLLDYLRASRGFDFGAYKVSSLMRRIQKRMREVGICDYAEYGDYLEVHPQEFGPLFDTVLINVTSFFRDPAAWTYLAEKILPRIADERLTEPIRVWSAGCSSGEEAYTLAMLLVETVGEEVFRQKVKIYATDVDLATARLGSFEPRQVKVRSEVDGVILLLEYPEGAAGDGARAQTENRGAAVDRPDRLPGRAG